MNSTQATIYDLTDALIEEVVEEEIEKYSAREGLDKDQDSGTYGQTVRKPYYRKQPYQVVSSNHKKS